LFANNYVVITDVQAEDGDIWVLKKDKWRSHSAAEHLDVYEGNIYWVDED